MVPYHSHRQCSTAQCTANSVVMGLDGLLCRRRDDDRSPERGRPSRTEHVSALLSGMETAHALRVHHVRGR